LLHFFGAYSSNKHISGLFRSTLFQPLIEDKLVPFLNQLREEYYIHKKKALETLIPFIIEFNMKILKMAQQFKPDFKEQELLA
jgi:hypothetical protein